MNLNPYFLMHFFSYARQVILMQWIISLEPIKGGINYGGGGGGGGRYPPIFAIRGCVAG